MDLDVHVALGEYNKTFGCSINHLKPLQIQTLESAVKGDTLCIFPTGYGKSLIYELLPFVSKDKAFVIALLPLNAIIHQQLQKLGNLAVNLTNELVADLTSGKQTSTTQSLETGKFWYIFSHPERIIGNRVLNKLFSSSIYQSRPVYLIVDEAHCILEWGGEFRPKYFDIYKLRSVFPGAKMVAMSATVTCMGQKEISKKLHFNNHTSITCLPTKNNISLLVLKRPSFAGSTQESYNSVFLPLLYKLREQKSNFPLTIVYCQGINWVGYAYELAQRVLGEHVKYGSVPDLSRVTMFHSSIEKESDKLKQIIFGELQKPPEETNLRLVFATVALGMGADLQHVQVVVHAGCPRTLETYVQEIGRAGRTGHQSTAVMFYNNSDCGHASKEMKVYCKNTSVCRRKMLNEHFSPSNSDNPSPPLCCDICQPNLASSWSSTCNTDQKIDCIKSALQLYVKLDTTNELQKYLTPSTMDYIAQNHERFLSPEALRNTFQLTEMICHSVLAILSHF